VAVCCQCLPIARMLARLRQLASCSATGVGCSSACCGFGLRLHRVTAGTRGLTAIHVDLLSTHTGLCGRLDMVHLDRVIRAARIAQLTSPLIAFENGEAHMSRCGPSAPSGHTLHSPP